MLAAYHSQNFDEAENLLQQNEQAAAAFGLTTLTLLYATRIDEFRRNPPPPDWDGVFDIKSESITLNSAPEKSFISFATSRAETPEALAGAPRGGLIQPRTSANALRGEAGGASAYQLTGQQLDAKPISDNPANLSVAIVNKRFAEIGQEIPPREQQSPARLGTFHKAEIDKWWPIVKAANIKAE